MTVRIHHVLLKFLKKYLFILKAAADGWRVRYIGGNQFEFYSITHYTIANKKFPDIKTFLKKYEYPFSFIT